MTRYLRQSEPFDLVVLDLMLPGELDGYSVCQEIRAGAAGEKNKDVAVLMLTARDDETSVVVGLEVGADDYITKPFRPRELVSRARAHLRRRQLYFRSSGVSSSTLVFPGSRILNGTGPALVIYRKGTSLVSPSPKRKRTLGAGRGILTTVGAPALLRATQTMCLSHRSYDPT